MRRGVGVGVHLCLGDTPMILEEGIGSSGAVCLGYTELQDTWCRYWGASTHLLQVQQNSSNLSHFSSPNIDQSYKKAKTGAINNVCYMIANSVNFPGSRITLGTSFLTHLWRIIEIRLTEVERLTLSYELQRENKGDSRTQAAISLGFLGVNAGGTATSSSFCSHSLPSLTDLSLELWAQLKLSSSSCSLSGHFFSLHQDK